MSADDLPNRIRFLRLEAKLSQQALADSIHVSKMVISALETGKIALSLDYMRRLSRAFNVSSIDVLNAADQDEFMGAEEMRLLRRFRVAHPVQRELILRMALPLLTGSEYQLVPEIIHGLA